MNGLNSFVALVIISRSGNYKPVMQDAPEDPEERIKKAGSCSEACFIGLSVSVLLNHHFFVDIIAFFFGHAQQVYTRLDIINEELELSGFVVRD